MYDLWKSKLSNSHEKNQLFKKINKRRFRSHKRVLHSVSLSQLGLKKLIVSKWFIFNIKPQIKLTQYTYTIWERFKVFSGSSGNLGMFTFPFSGTHRKDFLKECPICLLGDFYKIKHINLKFNLKYT